MVYSIVSFSAYVAHIIKMQKKYQFKWMERVSNLRVFQRLIRILVQAACRFMCAEYGGFCQSMMIAVDSYWRSVQSGSKMDFREFIAFLKDADRDKRHPLPVNIM